MSKSIVVVSDTQMPYEDTRTLKAVIKFIGEFQPDEVVQIGDLMDYPQPSRWSKGAAAEYEGSVFKDSEYGKRTFLEPLRAVYDGPVGVLEGNHDLRPKQYLSKYAPALAESGAFDMATLLDFPAFDVQKLPDFYEFSPGWQMIHGHIGGVKLSQESGKTAMNAVKRMGTSVIMGHTHRKGKTYFTGGSDAKIRQELTGIEVGHLMDIKAAHYLNRATPNWQKGFCVVHMDGKHVQADPIEVSSKRFIVNGVAYAI